MIFFCLCGTVPRSHVAKYVICPHEYKTPMVCMALPENISYAEPCSLERKRTMPRQSVRIQLGFSGSHTDTCLFVLWSNAKRVLRTEEGIRKATRSPHSKRFGRAMAPNVAYHMQPATSFHPYPAQYYTTTPTIPQQPMTAIAEQGGKMGETLASDLNLKESTDNNCSSSQPSEPPPALVGEAPLSANNMQSHQPGQGLQQGQVQAQVYPHNIQPTSLPNAFAQHFQQQQQHNQGYAIGMTTPLVTPPAAPMQAPLSPTSDEALNDANKKKKKGVPHVYHDYSSVQDQLGYVRKKTGGVTQPFPEKLMEMLTAEANNQTLCGWLPHGRAFIVRKPKQFTQEIMPKYFRQSKLTSFQRQLNLYGFRRITQGADAGAYYHELFLRGRPQLCMRMNRQKVKGTGHKQPADAQSEVSACLR